MTNDSREAAAPFDIAYTFTIPIFQNLDKTETGTFFSINFKNNIEWFKLSNALVRSMEHKDTVEQLETK